MPQTEDIIINVDLTGAKDANKGVDDLTKSLNKNTDATKDAEDQTTNYNNSLVEGVKDMKVFGVSINSLSKSFAGVTSTLRGVNGGLKAFKIALAATGIGAIVVALGSLVAVLTKTQGGMDLVTKAVNALNTVIDVVIDRFISFGQGLLKFFKGDFKEGISEMVDSFKGLGEEIRNEVEASNELSDAFARLETAKINNIVADAKLRAAAKQAEQIAKDETRSINERITAAKELERIEEQRAQNAIEIASEELRILQERNALGTSTNEDLRAEAELEAELFRLREESASRQIKNARIIQQLRRENQAVEVEAEEIKAAEIIRINEHQNQELEESDKKLHLKRLQLKSDELAAEAEKTKASIELAQKEASLKAQLSANLANAIAGLLGQESEAGKAFAIVGANINMWEAISAANKLPPPLSYIAMATALANGLRAIREIQATPIPKVNIAQTPFADGGPINGPSHSGGGVWLNAEGGEYIINKQAMRDPVNKAIAESINSGKQSRGRIFRDGGTVPRSMELFDLEAAISKNRAVLVLEDLDRAQTGVRVTENVSTLQ